MKKVATSFLPFLLFSFSALFLLNFSLSAQGTNRVFQGLDENIDKIVSVSCVPCHTSKGGFMSRAKLNFSEWVKYSPGKQSEKAAKMYSMLKKDAMPPKSARKSRPEIIPTNEQVETIKKWAESLHNDGK